MYNYLSINKAKSLIQEADILLYRGKGWISWFIQRGGEGKYSHVGLATWHHDNSHSLLETVEFREGKGGRVINLTNDIKKHDGLIDVYRPAKNILLYKYNPNTDQIEQKSVVLNAKNVTSNMRKMSGLPYGWGRIWTLLKHKLFGMRLLYNMDSLVDDDILDDLISDVYPVCSTAVAKSFHAANYDITHQKADRFMEPSDFARSGLTHYLFTLTT